MFKHTSKGILLALLGTFLFSLMNVMAKLLSGSMPFQEIVFFRGLIGSLIALGILFFKESDRKIKNHKLLILRGVLGGLMMLCSFYTIAHIKLGDAALLYNLSPIFVIFLARIFLKEKIPNHVFILLVISLLGAILVIKPGFSGIYSQYAIIGVLAAITAAGASVCIRKLSHDHSAYLIMLYFMVISTLISLPIALPSFVIPSLLGWLQILLMSILSFFALFFITNAFKYEKAGIISVTRYSDVLFNILWGYLIWFEVLDKYSLLGGLLILVSCILLVLKKNTLHPTNNKKI